MAVMKAIGTMNQGPELEQGFNELQTSKMALVKVKAFGLNRMDVLQREGTYPVPPQAPNTMGVEFSGTVEELATEAEKSFSVGDAVFGLAYGGAYAEYIAVSSHMLIHKPTNLNWEEAASLPEVYITALQAMYMIGEFRPGKTILWHAGASSVSIAGQQLSKANGASRVYATTRSDEKHDFCVNVLGATAGYDTKMTKWDEEVLRATNERGVDIIVDFIGPDAFAANLNAAAKDARVVNLASLSGDVLRESAPNFEAIWRKRIRYEGSTLRSRDEDYQQKLRDRFVEKALPLFQEGRLKPVIEKVYDWKDIQQAHKQMEVRPELAEEKGAMLIIHPGKSHPREACMHHIQSMNLGREYIL